MLYLHVSYLRDNCLTVILSLLLHHFITLFYPPFTGYFGYSFYFGQYLSVCLSLASIVFIYLIGVKITKPVVGLIAAGLFAVSPDMIYYGRRETQEALGIFLIILAIYFIVDFIINKKTQPPYFSPAWLWVLVIATKYTFVPAVLAVFGAAIIFLMGKVFLGGTTAARQAFILDHLLRSGRACRCPCFSLLFGLVRFRFPYRFCQLHTYRSVLW